MSQRGRESDQFDTSPYPRQMARAPSAVSTVKLYVTCALFLVAALGASTTLLAIHSEGEREGRSSFEKFVDKRLDESIASLREDIREIRSDVKRLLERK